MRYAERRRMLLAARRPRLVADDPANDDRQEQARANMRAFDMLGPEARRAIRASRFDAPAPDVLRRYGGPFAEDERVAARIRKDDDGYSGAFGPAAPEGI